MKAVPWANAGLMGVNRLHRTATRGNRYFVFIAHRPKEFIAGTGIARIGSPGQ